MMRMMDPCSLPTKSFPLSNSFLTTDAFERLSLTTNPSFYLNLTVTRVCIH